MADTGMAADAPAPQRPGWRRQPPPAVQGLLWMLLAGVLYSLLNATLRYVSLDLPPLVTSFLRFSFGLLFIAPILLRRGFGVFRTARPGLQVLRNLVHASAFAIWYVALPLIPLAEMTAIMFTVPLFVTLGAVLFLGEEVRWRRWLALAVGFAGVLIIVRPGLIEVGLGAILMMIAAPVIAASQVISKAQTRSDTPETIIVWQTVLLILFFLPAAIYFWVDPTWEQLGLLAIAGVLGTGANMAMVKAFRVAEISAVQSVSFLNIVWASLLGLAVFGDLPDLWTFIGAAIIVGSTTYIARREARIGRARSIAAPESGGTP